jgi:D-alanyl-D-alanine carboxypeptidase
MKRAYILAIVGVMLIGASSAAAYVLVHNQKMPAPVPAIHHRAHLGQFFNKQLYSLDDPASPWVIVNKQHPLNPINYAPADLTSIGNNQEMRAEAATALQKMFTDAGVAGYTLMADSGYRSYDTQVNTYNSIVKAYGQTYADTVSARPGFSEHQTGWAVDIGSDSCHVQDCFGDTPAGKWAAENAYKYGFILRYPSSLTNITGYSNETWHFRYVGTVLSNELHTENAQTLEQFFNVTGGTNYSQ